MNILDDTPISLSDDNKAVVLRSINEIFSGLSFLRDSIDDLKVTRYNILSLLVSDTKLICEKLDFKADLDKEKQVYVNNIREANQEIRNLREQLGKNTPLTGLGEALYQLDQKFYKYWKSLGFSLSDGHFEARWSGHTVYKVTVNFMLDEFPGSFSDTPVTDEENIAKQIEEMKKEVVLYTHDRSHHVIDNDQNKKWVLAKLRAKFPSVKINTWDSLAFSNSDLCMLRHAKVWMDIKDLIND